MNIQNIIRRKRRGQKTVLITIRITPEISDWLRSKDYSPTGIFYEAIRQLGFQEKQRLRYSSFKYANRRRD